MGWTNELYQVYELASKNPESGLLPIYHTDKKAQIELLIDEQGNFRGANTVGENDTKTIVPVTEKAAGRTGTAIAPYPFADELGYIAGDLVNYADIKPHDTLKYPEYMKQLKTWLNSPHSHTAVFAVYTYLAKAVLIEDLIKSGIFELDPETKKLKTRKGQENPLKIFVRFFIQYDDINRESRTWLDTSLYDSFIAFSNSLIGNEQLCCATGKISPATYNHPKSIIKIEANAKLISSNDDTGFTYRGRFTSKEQALSVSYDFSQKMHNALKWLIGKQGRNFDSLTLIIWANALEKLPDELGEPIESDWEEEEVYDSLPEYKLWLEKYIMGFKQDFTNNTKVMIMGLDAATTGRLSIAIYDELRGSDFLANLKKWHENSAWLRFRKGKKSVCSFSLYEIINAAYGEVGRDQILRLLPCIINGRNVPEDLVRSLHYKASNPLAYENNNNHRRVIEVVCGMYRALKKGDIPMGYDPNETNRSYLYGCLLAIADKAESDTYEDSDKNSRRTNARRYWAHFAQRPYQTWKNIEERLLPYLDKNEYRSIVERQIQDIMDKFAPEAFADNSSLETMYLLGYHHYMNYMYNKNKEAK